MNHTGAVAQMSRASPITQRFIRGARSRSLRITPIASTAVPFASG